MTINTNQLTEESKRVFCYYFFLILKLVWYKKKKTFYFEELNCLYSPQPN